MTTKPRLRLGSHLLPGLLAVALFVVLAVVFLQSSLDGGQGFEAGVSITASVGYALIDLAGDVESEGFLAALIIVAFVLDAALDGALMLAKREDEGLVGSAVRSGGLRQFVERGESEAETDGGTPVDEDGGER